MITQTRQLMFALVVLAATQLGACATVTPGQQTATEQMAMDPMLIQAKTGEDGELTTEVYDSNELFTKATSAFKKRRYDEAVEMYAIIVDRFPDSDFYLPSLYNIGLSYERLSRWQDALDQYAVIIKAVPGQSEATDAMYRTAECRRRVEDWKGVVEMTERIMGRTSLSVYDVVEAKVRRSDALVELGKLNEAETGYREAIQLNNRAEPEQAIPKDSHFVAGAHFGISRIYHTLFRDLKMRLPVARMESDLEDKSQLFMTAQSRYIRTMRLGNPYWSTAAGHHIGKMYEEFYADILAAEIPTDLNDEELEIYFDELRKKIRPLMERAVQIYEKNIGLSERFGVDNDFTEESQRSLERLKRYIIDDKLQAKDEALIRAGKEPNSVGKVGEEPPDERTAPKKDAPATDKPAKDEPSTPKPIIDEESHIGAG